MCLVDEECAHAEQVTWAVDVIGTMSELLLTAHEQAVKYVPGRVANKMANTYRGGAKTESLMPVEQPTGIHRTFEPKPTIGRPTSRRAIERSH